MNIAYMLGALNRGGTETLLLDVCNNLKGTEINAFLYHRKGGVLERDFNETGVPMIRLAPKSAAAIIPYLWNLRRSLKKYSIDIVHAQLSLDAVYASIATAGTGIKVVQTFHGFDFKHVTLQRVLIWLSVLFCKTSFFVSHTQLEYYRSRYKVLQQKSAGVIYNGINLNRIINAIVSNILEEYNISNNCVKLAMIGNFVPVRDQITVCRFLKLLNEYNVNFTFFFVGAKDQGNPHLYDDCVSFCNENRLKEKVIFTGSRNDVPGILKVLDAFVYASDHDTFGIAVIEAMAAGVPVFVNDWKVLQEICNGDRFANFYKSSNENDLLVKMKDFIAGPSQYNQKAKNAAEFAKEKYSIEMHTFTLQKMYTKIISRE